jgi:hypothetical protein
VRKGTSIAIIALLVAILLANAIVFLLVNH